MKPLATLIAGSLFAATAWAAEDGPDFLRWRSYEEPAFPAQLQHTVVRDGFATLVFTFDDTGRVTDRIVIAASHPAFSVSVLEAAQHWHLDSAGLPEFARRDMIRFEFQRSRSIVTMTQRDATKAAFSQYLDEGASAVRTYHERELGERLRPLAMASPTYPEVLRPRGIQGTATLSFVIDAEGGVRVPALTHATDPEFGFAALAALAQWRFSPPRHRGLPAQVMVERMVVFTPRPEPKATAPSTSAP